MKQVASSAYFSALKKAKCSFETCEFEQSGRRCIRVDRILLNHPSENFKTEKIKMILKKWVGVLWTVFIWMRAGFGVEIL
jgi:hypothetical protein